MTPARRLDDDAGQVGGIEMLPFGLLVFIVGGLLVANAWAVVDAKHTTSAAAHAAARSAVEVDDPATADHAAHATARAAVAGLGRDPDRVTTTVHLDGGWRRCARLTVENRYTVPALTLPWVGGLGRGITVDSVHSELVDPYRSGLPGEAQC